MTDIQPGDGVLMKAFKWHTPDGFAVLSYGAPKAKSAYHLFMWLGVYDATSERARASADDRLNTLGWVFDPVRAKKALASRRTAAVEAPATPEPATDGLGTGDGV